MDTSAFLGMLESAISTIGLRVVWALVVLNLANQFCLLIGTLLDLCTLRHVDRKDDFEGEVSPIEPTRPGLSAWMPGRARGHRLGGHVRGF